ncbi:MAG: hypothetical protein JNK53_00715 [Phycisphaerae bacterium]|nr:hypothetical protein [Phycisphaerae bacterium]
MRLAILAVLCLCSVAVAQSNNAAPGYKQAFQALGYQPYGSPATGLLTAEDQTFIGNLGGALTQGDRLRLDAIMLKVGPAIELLTESSRARKVDWELDRSAGFDLALPHLSVMRNATRLLRARALLASTDVDKGAALETLGTLGRLSAHSGQDKVAISSLVGSAIGSVFVGATDLAIESGAIDKSNAQQLLDAVTPLKRPDPYGYGDAVRGEYGMLAAEFSKTRTPEEIAALLGGGELTAEQREQLSSPDSVRGMLRQAKQVYDRASMAMENPDPIAARRELKEIGNMVESGRYGPLLQLFMPAFERMYESKLRSEQDLAILLGRLQSIADGTVTEAELLNAAVLLYRAAVNASATGADAQDSFELLRVAPAALDTLATERAVALLDRSQKSVMDPLLAAAQLKRCSFAVLRLPEPSLDVPLLGGVRGATRMLLTQGLQRARATKDANAAAPAIATVFRVAVLLSSDASLARAQVAQSIWNEAATALQDALAVGPMSPEDVAAIERALGTMPAQDPFGWRKAFDAEIKRLVKSDSLWQSAALTPEVSEMRERVYRQRGANSVYSMVALHVAKRGVDDRMPSADAPALERLTDVWPPSAVAVITAAHAAMRAAEDAADSSAVGPGAFEVPLDLPLEEQRSRLRKLDPVRGVVFVDVPTVQGQGVAVYTRPFDVLKAPRPAAAAALAEPTAPVAPVAPVAPAATE